MAINARIFAVVATVVAVGNLARVATAADPPNLFLEHLDEFVWKGPNGGSWQTSSNWTPPTGFVGQFPDDPSRVDAVDVPIVSVEGAAIYGPFTGDQTVNIADNNPDPMIGENVTVASLKLGGTGSAVTLDVTASGTSRLVFENYERNDDETHPADPNTTPPTPADVLWGFNQGRGLIWSTGTAGVGKENRISAPIQIGDDVDVEGDRDLHIYGNVYEATTDPAATFENVKASSINNLLSGGKVLYLHGNIVLQKFDQDISVAGTQDRSFGVNIDRGIAPSPAGQPLIQPAQVTRQSNVDIAGTLVGDGDFFIGSPQGSLVPLSTVFLRGDSRNIPGVGPLKDPADPVHPINDTIPDNPVDPYFRGRVVVNRANVVIDNDGAFGSGSVTMGNPSNNFGFNFISTADSRNVTTNVDMAQWQTVRGASSVPGLESIGDHSIEFSGNLLQSNTRGWVNLLPAGKTLTLSGAQYPLEGADNNDAYRIYTIDGSGKTVITGGIHNRHFSGVNPGTGHFRVRGTGTVVIDGSGAPIYDTDGNGLTVVDANDQPISYGTKTSTYSGYTFVEGGNLHFAKLSDVPTGLEILSSNGAVGLDAGVLNPANAAFLQKLNNAAFPNYTPPTTSPFVNQLPGQQPIWNRYDAGGLMLATSEYSSNLDFTTGNLANASNMTLAAREEGSTYTGTITPATSGLINPNTYQLGGGSGVLTLPNANQLTGANNLLVTNGGEVKLTNTNNYTGTTKIQSKYATSVQGLAATDRSGQEGNLSGGDVFTGSSVVRGSTLTVSTLANGGVASSIGSSTNAAANVQIQASTLKYVGGAQSTDRLFTVGTAGATVDASGTGAVNFTNTGTLGIDFAETRNAFVSDLTIGSVKNTLIGVSTSTLTQFKTDDLVIGMRLRDQNADPELDTDLEIQSIPDLHGVTVGERVLDEGETAWGGITMLNISRPIQFGPSPGRFLTLSGTNTGNNTLAPLIGNESGYALAATAEELEDGYGSVGIRKTGTGKWVLSNNNTYTGATNVEAGTLVMNGNQTGSGRTTVSSGATLGGGGSLPGALFNNGTVAPGDGLGTMTVKGDYSQSSGAALAVEIGGTSAGAFDSLNVIAGPDTGPVEGDYNGDSVVNAADYTVWRDHLGQTFQLLNEDEHASPGKVDAADYTFWKNHFGNANVSFGKATLLGTINIDLVNGFAPVAGNTFTILSANAGLLANSLTLSGESAGFQLIVNPTSLVLQYTGAGSGGFGGGTVPEPTSLVLFGIAFLAVGCARRRRG